jgi:hypothetical protein
VLEGAVAAEAMAEYQRVVADLQLAYAKAVGT